MNKMPASIGVNLRVTGHCSQGGRKYMEDLFSVAYQQTEDERDLEYAFFGIYDGHGGSEAAAFAKENLMDSIVKQRQFWSDNDEDVLKAIRNGYVLTHLNMWKELEKWPKTVTGLPSTAGTTASIAFIRRGKIYIGHVGDSAIVLGYQKDGCDEWVAKALTSDHKPESTVEMERISRCGGKVVSKAGVPRVVWNRPRLGHKGPIKKNTPMDEIPFLAVARSLGDLWSYNTQNDEFVVSPDPDVGVLTIDPSKFRCLIFGTDGLWNMISPEGAVSLVQATEKHNEAALVGGSNNQPKDWLNPSKSLVDHALERWSNTRMRADNTSVVTLMLDPPGPPRATVLRSRGAPRASTSPPVPPSPAAPIPAPTPAPAPAPAPNPSHDADAPHKVPQNGLTIMTRYSDVDKPQPDMPEKTPLPPCATLDGRFSVAPHENRPHHEDDADEDDITNYGNPAESCFMPRLLSRTRVVNTLSSVYDEIVYAGESRGASELRDVSPPPAPHTSLSADCGAGDPVDKSAAAPASPLPSPPSPLAAAGDTPAHDDDEPASDDVSIQINEVSSSSPTEAPSKSRGRRPRTEPRAPPTPAASNDRVLRSHDHEPQRTQKRQVASRGPSQSAHQAQPTLERVVILTRRSAASATQRRAAPEPTSTESEPTGRPGRASRSHQTTTPLVQKITRSLGGVARELRAATGAAVAATGAGATATATARAGNSMRAPGPARRTPAARREGREARSKENLGGRRRVRARAAPATNPPHPAPPSLPPQSRRADPEHEVHSTTDDRCRVASAPATPPLMPRALRSRNEPQVVVAPVVASGKRARCVEVEGATCTGAGGGGKTAKTSGERLSRTHSKRSSVPWAPALALRNRLRKRLAK